MPILQVYEQKEGLIVYSELQPPRNNKFMLYIPKRNQIALYLFNDDNISFSDSNLQFDGNYIEYVGSDADKDTFFTDEGIIAGMLLNLTGSLSNNIQVKVLSLTPGTGVGATQYLSETDFATHANGT